MLTIKYDNKEDVDINPLPSKNKITAKDMNEIKSVVNNLIANYLYPVGSLIFTYDGSIHPFAQDFPDCVEEIAEGLSLTTHKTTSTWPATIGSNLLKQSDLPNVRWAIELYGFGYGSKAPLGNVLPLGSTPLKVDYKGETGTSTYGSVDQLGNVAPRSRRWECFLNGNVEQTQFIPKSQPIRAWKIIKYVGGK